MSTSIIPNDIEEPAGILYSRTCEKCKKSFLVKRFYFGFTERSTGRNLFAAYGLDATGGSTLRGILDSLGGNFTCLRCHARDWLRKIYA